MRPFVSFACLLFVLCPISSAQQPKKRVAVFNFEYGTVHSTISSIFGTDVDIGKGIADLLVEKLVESGVYSVIERKQLDKILAEQNFSNSDRANPDTAAKIGRVLGVEAIIIGSITQFGRDDKSTSVGGGGFSRFGGRYGIGGVQKREAKAVVDIAARMVSTETAEVLGVAHGKGESTRGGTSLIGAGGGSAGGGGAYDMTSKNFGSTILGEATNQAVKVAAQQLDQNVSRISAMTAKPVSIDGMVADASGNTLILNVGRKTGLKVGDRLEVRRKVREIKDPASGKVLRSIEDKVGEVVITEVDDTSSTGTYTGSSPAQVKDTVRNPQ